MGTVTVTRCAPAAASGSESAVQFADKHQRPVSAKFSGGDDWQSNEIGFDDYTRMHTSTHTKGQVSTPAWASDPDKVKRVIAVRLRNQAASGGKFNPWLLRTDKESLLVMETAAWQSLRRYIGSGAHNELSFITALEGYKNNDGPLKFFSTLIYYRLQQGWTSVQTAELLGIRPEAVRNHCYDLNKVAKRLWPAEPELHLSKHHSQRYAIKPFMSSSQKPQQVVDRRPQLCWGRRSKASQKAFLKRILLLSQAGLSRAAIETYLAAWKISYNDMQTILWRAGLRHS